MCVLFLVARIRRQTEIGGTKYTGVYSAWTNRTLQMVSEFAEMRVIFFP